MRKRPDRETLSALDKFADQAATSESKMTSKQDDMTSSKYANVPSERLKVVSTRVPVDLIDKLQRIAAYTELSIQDVIIAGVRNETERVIKRYEEKIGHTLPPSPQKVKL